MDVIEEWVWFYYNQGFSIFPAKSTDPPSVDNKRPNIPTWRKYITQRPTKEEIQQWLNQGLFKNIAIVCGHVSGNIVVIDIDDAEIVPDLNLDLDKLIDEKGVWVQATGKEGRYHLISKHTGDPGGTVKDTLVHLEYRGNGAYIVACPSVHPSGKVYHFLNYEKPNDLPALKPCDVKSIFEDMVQRLYKERDIQVPTAPHAQGEGTEANCIKLVFKGELTEGKRNDTAFALANWYKHIKKLNPTEIRTLLNIWNKKNKPPLPSSELNSIVTSAQKSEKSTGCKRLQELGFCPYKDMKDCLFLHPKKRGKKEEVPIIETTKLFNQGSLYEQVYDLVSFVPRFVYIDEGTIKYTDVIEYAGAKYVPVNDKKAVGMGAVYFPEKPIEYGALQDLIKEIDAFIYKYLDISDLFRMFSTWYIIFSWVTDNIHTVPYLRVIGDFGTGKTRFIHTVGRLCYKPMIIAGATTSASIFRSIERWKGTLLLEEYTPRESGEEEDEIKILNCGFERGTPVVRCNMDNQNGKLDYFDCFGPKIISSRREFKDQALNSRCFTEILTESNREDIPVLLPPSFFKEQQQLRNKLLMFRLLHWSDLDPDKIQELIFPDGISKRIKQAFSSFAILFSHDISAMDLFMAYIEQYNREIVEERSQSFDGLIINAFFDLKKEGCGFVTSNMISQKMCEKGTTNKTGDPISTRIIGRHLKTLGLSTKLKKIENRVNRTIVEDSKILDSLNRKYISHNVDFDDLQQKISD